MAAHQRLNSAAVVTSSLHRRQFSFAIGVAWAFDRSLCPRSAHLLSGVGAEQPRDDLEKSFPPWGESSRDSSSARDVVCNVEKS